jgi:predicted glycoside hydrolase/deacetylase ChbG (UPF0249 family)
MTARGERILVVNADDIGLHPGITEGALAAHDSGVVTSCSVVATGSGFADAAARLRARPTLDVGVHLALTGSVPLSPPRDVASLVDGRGRLLPGWPALAWRALTGRLRPEQVECELRRQVGRAIEAGLAVSHLDGHEHLHVVSGIVEVVIALAAELGIPYVRCPRENEPWRGGPTRAPGLVILDRLGRRAARRVRAAGLRHADRTLGIAAAGRLDHVGLVRLIGRVDGLCELVCHPGLGQSELEAALGTGYRWEAETRALTDPGVRDALAARGVRLATFRELGFQDAGRNRSKPSA